MKFKFFLGERNEKLLNKTINLYFSKNVKINNLINLILKNYFIELKSKKENDNDFIINKNENDGVIIKWLLPKILNFVHKFGDFDEIMIYETINFPYEYFNSIRKYSSKF